MSTRVRIIGPGRAGGSFERALASAGWSVTTIGHGGPVADAASDTDLVLVCVPDRSVMDVAAAITPDSSVVVAHCAGSLGLDVLAPHPAVGSVHPLVALPSPEVGAGRLVGSWFGVAGDPLVHRVVDALDGHAVAVDETHRSEYHAAAVVASNHLVALMGQVERIAADAGVPLEAYLDLARGSLRNVAELGPTAALTGPVSRGDWDTVRRHLRALPPEERPAYRALADEAARLAAARQ